MTKSFAAKALIAAVSLGLALAPLAASAGEVGNRIHNENARIDQGVRDGQLTQGEYDRTENGLDRIEAQRRRDLRAHDGNLTASERARLNREENNLSDHIYFDKHNRAHQPGVR
jgi:hypothetical protein